MKHLKVYLSAMLGLALSLAATGCSNDVLDPTQIGRFQPVPVVNVILDNLGVASEADPTYAGAEEPTPADLIDEEQDYVLGVGDIVRISIYELQREGFPFVNDYVVTESGRISIPDVGQVRAAGLTEKGLEDEIKAILSPSVLRNPSVSVILMESQSRYFSIYGWGVARPGRYPIPRTNFRLTDAIALAGDVDQFNVTDIFITRDVPVEEPGLQGPTQPQPTVAPEQPTAPAEPKVRAPEDEIIDILSPFARRQGSGLGRGTAQRGGSHSTAQAEVLTAVAGLDEPVDPTAVLNNVGSEPAPAGAAQPQPAPTANQQVEWIFEDGRWKPVPVGRTATPEAPAAPTPEVTTAEQPPLLGTAQAARPMRTRVLRIPVDRLKGGDPRFDVVIRPGDRISVPGDVVGEFYVTGNVNNGGTITLTGRPMTLKMAIAAAGGLNELAWPKKVEVVRRLGRNQAGLVQEEIVMVDLDKIAKGLQPDFFIKPHDLINVGTHGVSRWLAVLRNAFRATYGFGFIYDRNFAADDFGNDAFPGHIGPLNKIF